MSAQLVGFTPNAGAPVCEVRRHHQVGAGTDAASPGELASSSCSPDLPDTVEYYVEASGVKSRTFKLTAIDLPGIKKPCHVPVPEMGRA